MGWLWKGLLMWYDGKGVMLLESSFSLKQAQLEKKGCLALYVNVCTCHKYTACFHGYFVVIVSPYFIIQQ